MTTEQLIRAADRLEPADDYDLTVPDARAIEAVADHSMLDAIYLAFRVGYVQGQAAKGEVTTDD